MKNAEQYLLKMPPGTRKKLNRAADESGRSVNTEIVCAIEDHLTKPTRLERIEQRLSVLEEEMTRPVRKNL